MFSSKNLNILVVLSVKILFEVQTEDNVDAELERLKGDSEPLLNIKLTGRNW